MDLLTAQELRSLFDGHRPPCVSVFLSTHRAGREIRQDPIRLKNLLRDAENRLLANGFPGSEAKDVLAPAQQLLGNEYFWRHQDEGLALFLSRGFFRHYRLPFQFPELVAVSERFHVKPLLALLTGDGRFFVLALSLNQVKLFQGTRHTVGELDLEGVPRSLAEALRHDNLEPQLQFRSLTAGSGGARTAMFHGHGGGADDAKLNVLQYFREIDRGLRDLLRDQRAPLVLAGVDYLLPIYREANTYPALLEEGIPGNPQSLSGEGLHAAAWRVVEPHFRKAQQRAMGVHNELSGTGRTSCDIEEILPAACCGRIECVFVPIGLQQWGTFNPVENTTQLHRQAQPGDEDLLNLVAIHAILNGGSVYVVSPSEIPQGAPVAALFRY